MHTQRSLTALWYVTVVPACVSISGEAPRPLSPLSWVATVVVSPFQLSVVLIAQEVLVWVVQVPLLTRDTSLSHIDSAIVSTTMPTVTVRTYNTKGVQRHY